MNETPDTHDPQVVFLTCGQKIHKAFAGEHRNDCANCLRIERDALKLQIEVLKKDKEEITKEWNDALRLNGEYRKALEQIAKLEPDDDGEKIKYGRAFNQATDIAEKVLSEKQVQLRPKLDHKMSCDIRDPATQPLGCNCGVDKREGRS